LPDKEEGMFDREMAKRAGENLKILREKKPLIHNITNYVVMNYTANALLACGASPVMAHATEEVEEMASFAGALVLNIGTLTPYWIDSMQKAGKRAHERNVPISLDPVGSGATRLRTDSARALIEALDITVVRGNASEVLSLAREGSRTKGVDSLHSVDEAAEAALVLAGELNTTLVITGAVDLVTDGDRVIRVSNGQDPVAAAATALAYFGLAGEKGAETSKGPGTFQIAMLDALYTIDQAQLQAGAKIQRQPI
jgi:hydroxyethylthiazole kinase